MEINELLICTYLSDESLPNRCTDSFSKVSVPSPYYYNYGLGLGRAVGKGFEEILQKLGAEHYTSDQCIFGSLEQMQVKCRTVL